MTSQMRSDLCNQLGTEFEEIKVNTCLLTALRIATASSMDDDVISQKILTWPTERRNQVPTFIKPWPEQCKGEFFESYQAVKRLFLGDGPGDAGDADKILDAIKAWAEAVKHGAEGEDTGALNQLVEDLMETETSFAEQNARRLRMVVATFQQENFETVVNIVDMLMNPLDAIINKLLQRSSLLRQLRLQKSEEGQSMIELASRCQSMFLNWASGQVGFDMITQFLKNLQSFQLAEYCHACRDTSMSMTCFQLTIFAMADTWRRSCLTKDSFPWCLFSLATCEEGEFEERWGQFRQTMKTCPECVDASFSQPLLRATDFEHVAEADKSHLIYSLQHLLQDVATVCPLSTDLVENLHGQNQNALFLWRGSPKGPVAAAEMSILASAAAEHARLKEIVMAETMPSKMQLANMYKGSAARCAKAKRRLRLSPKKRLLQAAKAKPRRLSAFNVYLREQMKAAGGQLNKQAYALKCKQLGAQWRQSVSEEEQKKYTLQAEYEQTCRDELQTRPLESASSRKRRLAQQGHDEPEAASVFSANVDVAANQTTATLQQIAGVQYQKKISGLRLKQNCHLQAESKVWSQHGLGLQDETGALSRSRIDLETSQDIVDDAVACIHSTLEDIGLQFVDDMPDLPRVSCKSLYGVCQKHPFFKKSDVLCRQLARQTADRKLPTGSLVTLELKGIASSSSSRPLSSAFFLGALFQRPLQQVLVKAWPQRTSNDGLQKFSLRQDSGDAVPNFQTSHTVFLDFAKEMMAAADPGATAVSVTVLSYEFENYLWSVQQLQVTVTGSVLHRFELGFSQPDSEAKPKFELPFGLKLKKKPRKAQKRARGSIVADGQEAVMPTDIAAQENAEEVIDWVGDICDESGPSMICGLEKEAKKPRPLSAKSITELSQWEERLGMVPGEQPYTANLPADSLVSLTYRERRGMPKEEQYMLDLELLALQGFDPRRLSIVGPQSKQYSIANLLAGNAMTTSILSAILFGILCWALPTENGLAIFKPPDPQSLANSSGDDDDGESSGSSGYQSSDSDATSSGISGGGRGSDAHSDAPDGCTEIVTMLKEANGCICRRCFYVKRGSLNNMRVSELVANLESSEAFADKHEKVDVTTLLQKKDEDYVDISQVLTWRSLKKFTDTEFPDQQFKNDSMRRAFLVRRGYKIQKDENGKEGVAIGGEGEEKQIKIGKRLASSKLKQEELPEDISKEQVAAMRAKNAAGLAIAMNDKGMDDDDAADENSADSDGSSVLGLGGDAPTPPRRCHPNKSAPSAVGGSNTKDGKDAKPEKEAKEAAGKLPTRRKSQQGSPAQPQVPLEPAQKALQLLKGVSLAALWKGNLRDADVESRVKKMGDALAPLEEAAVALQPGPQATKVQSVIEQSSKLLEEIPILKDVIVKLRCGKKMQSLLEQDEFGDSLTVALQSQAMDPETLADILKSISKSVLQQAAGLLA
ncbi:hypothetical protein AK812_SmicGene907 [Symbiodinium microadriaticum]|uniref:Uncharacterized protein n=1 Tax=Symbiodinium microadriaticum TaxID=2951 RepID=A0A1Q9F5E5_SYMMI|nr:hypothetical protein AK812_SmicGene907 [Symbiodinium microadriaticum]